MKSLVTPEEVSTFVRFGHLHWFKFIAYLLEQSLCSPSQEKAEEWWRKKGTGFTHAHYSIFGFRSGRIDSIGVLLPRETTRGKSETVRGINKMPPDCPSLMFYLGHHVGLATRCSSSNPLREHTFWLCACAIRPDRRTEQMSRLYILYIFWTSLSDTIQNRRTTCVISLRCVPPSRWT